MYCKMHNIRGNAILACCDEELLGKKIENEKFSVEINASFYKHEKVGDGRLRDLMREANSMNFFGEKCIRVAIEEGFINQSNIIMIGKVPHCQVYKI